MQITYEKLGEIAGLNKNTLRVYMGSYKLTKYLTKHYIDKVTRHYIQTIVFNREFIHDFGEYLKLKNIDVRSFKQKANYLLKR